VLDARLNYLPKVGQKDRIAPLQGLVCFETNCASL
jgi:hypothetical protein